MENDLKKRGLEIGHTPHTEPSQDMAPRPCILAQGLFSVMLLQPPLLLQPGSNCHGFWVNPKTHTIEYSHAQRKPSHPRSLTHVLVCVLRRFTLSEGNLTAQKRARLARARSATPHRLAVTPSAAASGRQRPPNLGNRCPRTSGSFMAL